MVEAWPHKSESLVFDSEFLKTTHFTFKREMFFWVLVIQTDGAWGINSER